MRLWLLLGLTLSEPAMAADQFDLVCTGGHKGRTQMRYRIDLIANEYCAGDCQLIQKIQQVTEGEITFYEHQPQNARDETKYSRVNRSSGAWKWYYYSPVEIGGMNVSGTCEKAGFSGFPAKKF